MEKWERRDVVYQGHGTKSLKNCNSTKYVWVIAEQIFMSKAVDIDCWVTKSLKAGGRKLNENGI